MSNRTTTGQDDEPMKHLNVCSLGSDRHGLMSGIGKIARRVYNISAEAMLHLATGLEKLRRKQLVALLLIKIDEAAHAGWIVTPFDSRDLDDMSSDMDL